MKKSFGNHRLILERYLPWDSGHLGIRTLFNDQTNSWINEEKQFHILAEDAPTNQEKTLLALTPEVCRFTAAIEDFYEKGYDDDGNLTGKTLAMFLREAIDQIQADRSWLESLNRHFFRSTKFPFVDLQKVSFADAKRLLNIVKEANINGDGTVDDLEDLYTKLITEKAKIDQQNLDEYQNDDLTPPFKFNPPLYPHP